MNQSSESAAWDMVEALSRSGLVVPPIGAVDPDEIEVFGKWHWGSHDLDLGVVYGFQLEVIARDIAEHDSTFSLSYLRRLLSLITTSPAGDIAIYIQHGLGSHPMATNGDDDADRAQINLAYQDAAAQLSEIAELVSPTDRVLWLAYNSLGSMGIVNLDALRNGADFDATHEHFDGETSFIKVVERCGIRVRKQQAAATASRSRMDADRESRPTDAPIRAIVPHLAEALRRLEDDSHLVISVHGSIRYVQFATFRPNLRLETIGTGYLEDAGETWSVDEVVWLADHGWHDADDGGNPWRDWIPADEVEAAAAAIDALVNVHGMNSLDQVWFQSEDDNALAALEGLAPPGPDIEQTGSLPPEGLRPTSPERAAEINAVLNAYVEGKERLPSGTKYVAVIDYVDHNSVLEVLGMIDDEVYRRHDRRWHPDAGWRKALPKAPARSILALSPDQLDRVLPMVDSSTGGQPFKRLELSALEMYWPSHRPNDPALFDWSQLDSRDDSRGRDAG